MPAQLTTNAVRYRCDKFSAETKLGAQLRCKFLRAVVLLGHVPLELVSQRDVTNMNVQLQTTTQHHHRFNPFTADPVKALHFAILVKPTIFNF